MNAAASSIQLKHFILRNMIQDTVQGGYLQSLAEATPVFKATKIYFIFHEQSVGDAEEEVLLAALKNNYVVQECFVQCGNRNWFSDTHQNQLDFYLDRNHKLAQWTENPELVPQELWCYAVGLAVKAGINSLYQSLLSIAGQEAGLKQKGRKRKWPSNYNPV